MTRAKHMLRTACWVLVGSLGTVSSSTSSPGTRAAYLSPETGTKLPGAALSGPTAHAQSAGTPSVALREPLASTRLLSAGTVPLGAQQDRGAAAQHKELWVPPAALVPQYEPVPDGEEPRPAPLANNPHFLGQRDEDLLSRICTPPIKSIRPLGGGASISLRVTFEGGVQAALKPEQVRITRYQSEIAAYRISLALGLDKVPPSCVRRIPVEQLQAGMPKSLVERMQTELVVDKEGMVAAAVISWVPHLHGMRLEESDWWREMLQHKGPLPANKRKRVLEIASLILFDYLILNHDRWSGGNTHDSNGQMVFLDQGAGFGPERHHRRSRAALKTLKWAERFPKDLVHAVFALDSKALSQDLASVLSPDEIEGFQYRLRHAREYLRALHKAAPEDSWLLWGTD